MKIEKFAILHPAEPLAQEIWDLYRNLFTPINHLAAQRHLMTYDEFMTVMGDPMVTKYVAFSEASGWVCGIGALTPYLESVPLVSPEFYRARYGELVDQRRLFYVMFIGVETEAAGPGGYADLLREMTPPVADAHGVAALDLCARNLVDRRLGEATHRILDRAHPGVVYTIDDHQTFVSYDYRNVRPA